MTGICDGRIVVITGAGGGLGRSHALELAAQGARLVVNDIGGDVHGGGTSHDPADDVVAEIRDMGGEAIASYDDVADWDGAQRAIGLAIETYGGLDVVVNNAGILRDRMLVNMSIEEWDAVVRVHLRGTFAPTRCAAGYWRERVKQGLTNDARVISTSSGSGLYGNVGQTNYGAAKAGIAAFTLIAAMELQRYGITVNAIAPMARTRMSAGLLEDLADDPGAGAAVFDEYAPENVSPLIAWLSSAESASITGQVFNMWGGDLSVAEGWCAGPGESRQDRFDATELGKLVPELVAAARPHADVFGRIPERKA